MSFLEQRPSGQYYLVFRFGGPRFKKGLKTSRTNVAEAARVRLARGHRRLEPCMARPIKNVPLVLT
jgi:hypothetical protein